MIFFPMVVSFDIAYNALALYAITMNNKIFIEKQRVITENELKLDKLFFELDKYNDFEVKQFVSSVINTYSIKY